MKGRRRRRPSTRSADQDTIVCPTASKIKPSASRLTATIASCASPSGAIQRQLMKLKPATAAQISACHQRKVKVSSNSARVNSQNTTTLPVESAIKGACQADTGGGTPIADVAACAADPNANGIASRPAAE